MECCLRFNPRTGHTSDGPNVRGEFRIRSSVEQVIGLAPTKRADRGSSSRRNQAFPLKDARHS